MSDSEKISDSVPKTNVPELSVSELSFSLKKTLEDNYSRVRVRGELSRVSIAGSGHMYSSLKDDRAVIDAVCWKGTMARLGIKPEEGLEVICTGRVSTYPARSNYQLIIESMELAGEGALLKLLEERRKKLAAEGLFAEERKRPIPFLPEVIGVVTSPTGAVIRDILHRLDDRFPRHVLVWPVLVQGEGAAEQVAAAIKGFQTIHEQGLKRPDILIVARGGGSLEDLMAFNEEIAVRAVAESEIPVIAAVGHETDTTLVDYAADLRAPTPTGAAEKAVPVRAELKARLMENRQRLYSGLMRLFTEHRHRLEAQTKGLGDPSTLLEVRAQTLDHAGDKLKRIYRQYLSEKNAKVIENSARLHHPKDRLEKAQEALNRWREQLAGLQKKLTAEKGKQLSHAANLLDAYSFKKTLNRGFAVVRSAGGGVISDAGKVKSGQVLNIKFRDDDIDAVAGKAKKKPAAKSQKNEKQESLF